MNSVPAFYCSSLSVSPKTRKVIQSNTEASTVTTEIKPWTGIQEVQFSPCIKHPPVNHHHRLLIIPCKDTQSVVWDVKEKISRTSVYGEKKKPKLIQKILKTYPLPSTFLSFHLFNWVIALSLFSPFPCTHSPRSSCYILSPISISQLFFKNFQKKMQLSPCDTRRRVNTQTNEEKSLQYTRICSILIAKKTL